ncbi:MAG: flagellar biosynthetic protein FliO, partial [Anaerovibrio sp.]
KSVCVVEIGGKVVLLGVTEHQVNLLAEIEDADEIDRLRRQAVAQPVDMGAFASQLSSLEELTRRVPSLFREGLNRRG